MTITEKFTSGAGCCAMPLDCSDLYTRQGGGGGKGGPRGSRGHSVSSQMSTYSSRRGRGTCDSGTCRTPRNRFWASSIRQARTCSGGGTRKQQAAPAAPLVEAAEWAEQHTSDVLCCYASPTTAAVHYFPRTPSGHLPLVPSAQRPRGSAWRGRTAQRRSAQRRGCWGWPRPGRRSSSRQPPPGPGPGFPGRHRPGAAPAPPTTPAAPTPTLQPPPSPRLPVACMQPCVCALHGWE